MDFGEAIRLLKAGKRVSRVRWKWNGQRMWIALMPMMLVPEASVSVRTQTFVPPGDLHVAAYISMWTAQRVWQPGWVPSQADMLTEDWFEVTDSEAFA